MFVMFPGMPATPAPLPTLLGAPQPFVAAAKDGMNLTNFASFLAAAERQQAVQPPRVAAPPASECSDATSSVGAARDRGVSNMFVKIKRCRFFGMGTCTKGSACTFAHGKEELRPAPDFFRTKLCPLVARGQNCPNENCKYAHCKDDRRRFQPRKLDLESAQASVDDDSLHSPGTQKSAVGRSRRRARGCRGGGGSHRLKTAEVGAKSEGSDDEPEDLAAVAKTLLPHRGRKQEWRQLVTFDRYTTPSTEADGLEGFESFSRLTSSNSSLNGFESDDGYNEAGAEGPKASAVPQLRVENTFITMDVPLPPFDHRLRRVKSAPGRLHDLADDDACVVTRSLKRAATAKLSRAEIDAASI